VILFVLDLEYLLLLDTAVVNKRIGFACKWIDRPDQIAGIKPKDDCKLLNTMGTTVAWLNRQSQIQAEEKLWEITKYNIEAIRRLVERVGEQHEDLRMVRLGSDLLPVFTEPTWGYFYNSTDVISYCEHNFAIVGDLARQLGVRLSFHPGQFCVLASESPDIVERSIEELEYHATMAKWMGYGKKFQDFKINVHISGRKGPQGIRDVYGRLSPEARNCLTLENEEYSHGLDDCLSVSDLVPTVLDIHHYWIREGVYIDPASDSVKMVVDSWRGVRPTMHYSVSREDCLVEHSRHQRPARDALIEAGHNKQKLRAHSDYYWNTEVNNWALSFRDQFDIMCESKAKNLASFALHEYAKQAGY
jgi:UV DNA damage repair endonuclease